MISRIIYILVYSGMWLLSIMPFFVLHCISDFFYFIIYHIIRYRRKVTRTNLIKSFPDKSSDWIRKTEKRFYKYLCDDFLEDIKTMNLSAEQLQKHMTYKNTEDYLGMIEKHAGIIVMIPHYANYEWLIGMGSIMKKEDIPAQVYKPLKDPYLDRLFQHIRSRFGGYNIPKHSTVKEIIKLRREGKKFALGLITDQSPNISEAHYWTTFLHQDTVFMDGAEKLAKLLDCPVFYSELTKTKRGYCTVEFQMITEHPKETADGEITEKFVRHMEKTITNEPAYWLWTHKRWKRNRNNTPRA